MYHFIKYVKNIYEPSNLTPQILKIIIDQAETINSQENFFDKIKWIQ